MLAQVQSRGWVVLDEVPDREIVVGAVTKPWEANVTFRSIPANEFVAFQEPEYVKIVWTVRVDAIGPNASVFRTERALSLPIVSHELNSGGTGPFCRPASS